MVLNLTNDCLIDELCFRHSSRFFLFLLGFFEGLLEVFLAREFFDRAIVFYEHDATFGKWFHFGLIGLFQ